MMRLDRVCLREVHLELVHPFETSFGMTRRRTILLLEAQSGQWTGWGECVAGEDPYYSSETVETAWGILEKFILPAVLGRELEGPGSLGRALARIRGHRMAKAALEAALWDLEARRRALPLWRLIGGRRDRIPCGVSIGIQPTPDILLQKISRELEAGYRKIKIKIKPGWDVEIVRRVRDRFPDIPLMVDANSAYTLEDAERLAALDAFSLLMIEQPLEHDDLAHHARLQARLQTPICLDESIRHLGDVGLALELGACRVINIKMGRVGGLSEARRIHDLCRERQIPVWCGGMLESGVGRAHNIALSTLPNFTIPGDVSASSRYYARDTVQPPVEVDPDGCITVPEGAGIGYEPDREWIEQNTARRLTLP